MAYKYHGMKINGKRKDEHRLIMEETLGIELDFNHVVHHKNEDGRDNDPENLELLTRSEHSRKHAIGRKMSDEAKRKISEFNKDKICDYARKLTNEDIDFIRANYIPRNREFGTRGLGRKFGVDHETIRDILAGRTYRHF
jgi:hypothetical protein